MKLKSKLVLGNTLVVILTMGCLSLAQLLISSYYSDQIQDKTSVNISENFVNYAKQQAKQSVTYLSEALLNPLFFYDISSIGDLLEPALETEAVISIKVFDATGLVVHTGEDGILEYGSTLNMPKILESVLVQNENYLEIAQSTLVIARPLVMNNTLLGGIVMKYSLKVVQEDIAKNNAIIQDINGKSRTYSTVLIILITIAMCFVSIFFSIIMAGTLTRPITKLLLHSKRISEGNYQVSNQVQRSDELGELALAFDTMDSKLKQRTDAIEFMAYNDQLTQLPNRTQFLKRLDQVINRCSSSGEILAVFFIDLDEFKRVNDHLGHQAGDELLCEVAIILEKMTQKVQQESVASNPECVIARVGGDEFLLYLSGISNLDEVSNFADNIVNIFKQPIYLRLMGESVFLGVSIGIAIYSGGNNKAEDIVKNADIAMYSVKNSGKNGYCYFNNEMQKQVIRRGLIEKELRVAIDDFSQFQLFYQPIIDLKTGYIKGVEALLRWCHPEKGYISPADFIPIAESTDIIHYLGEWVIEQACKDIQEWSSASISLKNFHVALNLSSKQLFDDKTLNAFLFQIEKYQVDASQLHVEVTETALMLDTMGAKKTLDSLRNIGIEVWLDDFGTGYSSLGYLREFNIDGLKIDQSFVNDIDSDLNDRALCSAIISMAHQLNINIVAEGIETKSQSCFLSQSQCDFGQGYLFAKPMPSKALKKLLEDKPSFRKDLF